MPASGTRAMAAASRVRAQRSSGSRLESRDLPQAPQQDLDQERVLVLPVDLVLLVDLEMVQVPY